MLRAERAWYLGGQSRVERPIETACQLREPELLRDLGDEPKAGANTAPPVLRVRAVEHGQVQVIVELVREPHQHHIAVRRRQRGEAGTESREGPHVPLKRGIACDEVLGLSPEHSLDLRSPRMRHARRARGELAELVDGVRQTGQDNRHARAKGAEDAGGADQVREEWLPRAAKPSRELSRDKIVRRLDPLDVVVGVARAAKLVQELQVGLWPIVHARACSDVLSRERGGLWGAT